MGSTEEITKMKNNDKFEVENGNVDRGDSESPDPLENGAEDELKPLTKEEEKSKAAESAGASANSEEDISSARNRTISEGSVEDDRLKRYVFC